jgi:tetratricopeptide (TPR) repeat protein
MQSARTQRLLALLLACGFSVLPALSSATIITPEFSWSGHPMYPVKPYIRGHLGIVLPTFRSSYLVIAYRYFSGKSLSGSEADEANAMIEKRLAREDTGCDDADPSAWLEARKSAMTDGKDATVDTMRTLSGDSPSTFYNIQTDAFVTAAKTLQALVTKFGAGSSAVKDWIAAQDMVFANGSMRNASIPAPLQAGDKLLQQDRAYQIAAANFYAMQFDQAIEQFSKIAQDIDSPWSHISRYLAVRSLIRKATLLTDPFDSDLLTEAKKQLDVLLQDHSMAELHEDLVDLADFVVDKLVPADSSLAKQREHQLGAAMMTHITTRNFREYTNVFGRLGGDADDDSSSDKKPRPLLNGVEITDWIDSFQSPKAVSREHALARWKSSKSLPWLIAALSKSDSKDSDVQQLLDAASKVSSSNPAFATVSYEAGRLLTEKKQYDQARNCVDRVLAQKELDLSSRNLLLELRIELERNLDDYIRDSVSETVGTSGDGDVPNEDQAKQKQAILPVACQVYDESIPLSIFKAAAQSKVYSDENRQTLTKIAWVKAILIGNEPLAGALAKILVRSDKKYVGYYNSYLHAGTPSERMFAAAFFMLNDEGSTPSFDRRNWWWWRADNIGELLLDGPKSLPYQDKRILKSPVFLSAADLHVSAIELAKLKRIPAAPAYLGEIVVAWAKSHPEDTRVPEALHLAVRCTKLGERDKISAKLSKEAFLILHHRYAKSDWTTATPYYY